MKRSQRIRRNFHAFRDLLGRFRHPEDHPRTSYTYGEVVAYYSYWRAMDRWNRGWCAKPYPIHKPEDEYVWWIHKHRKPERLP